MRKLYDKFLNKLNISGSDFGIFMTSLLLAFIIWLIHNLGLKYNDYLTAPVIAQCNIEGHANKSINHSNIVARCRATGYATIESHIKSKKKAVVVNFAPSVMRHYEEDRFYILASDLAEYTHLIYGEGISLDHFVSDTVFFTFPEVDHKKVPVYPVYSLDFQDQYMSSSDFAVEPDSLTLYGNKHRLENIDKVFTEMVKQSNLSSSIEGIVNIEKIKDVRMSVDKVHYSMEVRRFVEFNKTLPINVRNVPVDKKLHIYPSSAVISAKFTFPVVGDDYENLELEVDYEDFIKSISGKCVIELSSNPKGLISYNIEPAAVTCVLEDR